MTDPDPKGTSLSDIDAKLKALRERREVETRPSKGMGARWQGAEFAWRMVIDLTAGVAVGCAIGWGLDELLGTKPLFMVVFILFGFGAGIRVMLQSAKELQSKNKARAEGGAGETTGPGADAPQDEGR